MPVCIVDLVVSFNADPSDFLGINGMPDRLTAEFNSSNIKWHKYPATTDTPIICKDAVLKWYFENAVMANSPIMNAIGIEWKIPR